MPAYHDIIRFVIRTAVTEERTLTLAAVRLSRSLPMCVSEARQPRSERWHSRPLRHRLRPKRGQSRPKMHEAVLLFGFLRASQSGSARSWGAAPESSDYIR